MLSVFSRHAWLVARITAWSKPRECDRGEQECTISERESSGGTLRESEMCLS